MARVPTALLEVMEEMAELLEWVLKRELGCSDDAAHDHAFDAVFDYIARPESFDPTRARLRSYLVASAKHKAIDRLRSEQSSARRGKEFDRHYRNSRISSERRMELVAQARELWQLVCQRLSDPRDQNFLTAILEGESNSEILAKILGGGDLPAEELQLYVKRNRDRIFKVLERLGGELNDNEKS